MYDANRLINDFAELRAKQVVARRKLAALELEHQTAKAAEYLKHDTDGHWKAHAKAAVAKQVVAAQREVDDAQAEVSGLHYSATTALLRLQHNFGLTADDRIPLSPEPMGSENN